MIRFTMPSSHHPRRERIRLLNEQFDSFLHSDSLRDYLSRFGISSTDPDEIDALLKDHDPREKAGKAESQAVEQSDFLLKNRYGFFPLYEDMGLITINNPLEQAYERIALLAGSSNSNFDKTKASSRLLRESVREIAALSCFKPITHKDMAVVSAREDNKTKEFFETEAGSFAVAFSNYFHISPQSYEVDSPRNMNLSCGVRVFSDNKNPALTYRIIACPSSSENERPNTYDTIKHYLLKLKEDNVRSTSSLFITNNQYCNYQFMACAIATLETEGIDFDFDIVGCSDDDNLATADGYNTTQYFGDIRYTAQWIGSFRRKFG